MQSQQKRVKWSRGETAEALEERTDTGITQASVELMENCIPDVYGNVSRRPGLKILPSIVTISGETQIAGFDYDEYLQVIPFYITIDDYILIGIHFTSAPELIRIKDFGYGPQVVHKVRLNSGFAGWPKTGAEEGLISGVYTYRPVSYSQQNNYMIIADAYSLWKITISNINYMGSFTATREILKFSAGWYAPSGTQTKKVNRDNVPGLEIQGPKGSYVYTDVATGLATTYSTLDTGLTGIGHIPTLESNIPVGSIITLPNMGAYMRVEGYYESFGTLMFPGITFDSVGQGDSNPGPGTGKVCMAVSNGQPTLRYYNNGVLISELRATSPEPVVACSASGTGYSKNYYILFGGGMWTGWQNQDVSATKTYIYGSLLTPIADANGKELVIEVEYGYESLQPSEWNATANYPHPRKVLFSQQRLWAGGWAKSTTEQYAITIGSQIARYNDFKNEYNQANEPITLDILTKFKEKIVHLVDYNGLKIMTDAYEYMYDANSGIQKQSANGSFEYCDPIVFDSLCLYIDSTGCQLKAMQYEFQSNVFNSTTINQMAPHDLVWYPWCMAQYEDKYNSTGKYLFLVNRKDANARMAVCNFIPGNQAEIWSRWTLPKTTIAGIETDLIHSVVNTTNSVLFMVNVGSFVTNTIQINDLMILPAILDFNAESDYQSELYTINNTNYFAPINYTYSGTPIRGSIATIPNITVNIYSNGEFQFQTTTGAKGEITDDISQLTNVTVGLPINATIRSHPIDVGGKTKTIKKRIGKSVLSVHNTNPDAIIVNGKTGYMNPQKDKINFYGVTGMKDEIKYVLTNKNGARFTIESLTMNIEYGTLIS